jgi:NADH:ubiquinone oxidoreductase subunit 2 (subunit N)
MWTPDVYEGSPTSVTAFFCISAKSCRYGCNNKNFICSFWKYCN